MDKTLPLWRSASKHILVALLSVFVLTGVFAQQKGGIDVTLKVLDEAGEAVIGAAVYLKSNPQKASMVGVDGICEIKSLPPDGTLVIEFLGMQTTEVSINNQTRIDVVMKSDAVGLQEVVVTGYGGTQLRSKVTNSISKVTSQTLTTGLYSNPAQALAGAVPGLRIISNSGNPGSSPTIILRGGTNLDGSGSPLTVVDGQVRSMNDLNPEDIESMEVLKDAGATAIYGARANNGVILITLKRGKEGTSQITAKAKVAVNFLTPFLDFLSAQDYLYYMRTGYKNASQIYKDASGKWVGSTTMASLTTATPYGTGNLWWNPDSPSTTLNGNLDSRAVWSTMKYTEDLAFLLNQGWKTMTDPVYGDKLIFKESYMGDFNIITPTTSQDYNLAMNGGNDKGSYYASLGYNDQKGMPVGTYYNRLNFTFNGDYNITPWLKSISGFQFAEAKWNGLPPTQGSEANYFGRVLSVPPTFRGYNADGEMLLGANTGDGNQQYQIEKFIRKNQSDKFTINQGFNVKFADGLSLKINAIWMYEEANAESFNRDYQTAPGDNWNRARNASASWWRELSETYNAVLSYDKQIKDHYISAMVGSEYYNYSYISLAASGSGAPTDDLGNLSLTENKENMRQMSNRHSHQRILSFFGRVNYDYLGKYLISGVVRQDGYSRLSQQNRWGLFPGVSAGWIMTKEDFFDSMRDIVSFAKIRASFGLNGNVSDDYVGSYTVQGQYGANRYGGGVGYLLSGIPNPYLTWEKSRTAEVGIDIGLLQNRFNINMTYYNRLTLDKFAGITLPVSSGISSILSNNGKIQNQGFEFDLQARIIDTPDWQVSVGINGAYNINKIVELPHNGLERNRQNAIQVYTGNGDEKEWVGGYQQGKEPGVYYAFKYLGVYKSESEIPANLIDRSTGINGSNNRVLYSPDEWAKLENKGEAFPLSAGDAKWLDVNGDGVIDDFDKVRIGNSRPRWTGGLNINASWRGLSLWASMDYALGFWVVDHTTQWFVGATQGTYNATTDALRTWSETNPNGDMPIYIWADQLNKRNYSRQSSLFYHRGDYLNFREVSLSYSLPKEWTTKIKMSRVDVSVTGQNLGFLSAMKNAWMAGRSTDTFGGGYPNPKTVIIGLSITF